MMDMQEMMKKNNDNRNDNKRKVTVDGVEYLLEDLSENAKGQLQGITVADTEIKRLSLLTALAQTARNAYLTALSADLPEPKSGKNDDE